MNHLKYILSLSFFVSFMSFSQELVDNYYLKFSQGSLREKVTAYLKSKDSIGYTVYFKEDSVYLLRYYRNTFAGREYGTRNFENSLSRSTNKDYQVFINESEMITNQIKDSVENFLIVYILASQLTELETYFIKNASIGYLILPVIYMRHGYMSSYKLKLEVTDQGEIINIFKL